MPVSNIDENALSEHRGSGCMSVVVETIVNVYKVALDLNQDKLAQRNMWAYIPT